MHDSPLTVTVQMDDRVFSAFALFDGMILPRRWLKLLLFLAGMLAFALVNLFTGAPLLFWVLLVIGLITPLAFVVQFRQSVVSQITRYRLEKPKPVYTLTFPQATDAFTLQVTDQEAQHLRWASLAGAYRTGKAIYLYAARNQAYIVPFSQLDKGEAAAIWALAVAQVPPDRVRVYTHRPLPDNPPAVSMCE